jgi:RimJ/RimL family protein N-acetyltransferase
VAGEPVVLTDGVVTLRPLGPGDAAATFAACQDSLIAHFLSIPHPYTEADAREWVSARQADWDGDDERSFAITEAATGEFLGAIARHLRAPHRAEVGYWLAPDARGRGAATRALRLLRDWSLDDCGLVRLELFTHPDNHASGGVALRAGLAREGVRRGWCIGRDGNPQDKVFYAILRGDPRT